LNLPALNGSSANLPTGWHQEQLPQIERVTDWSELEDYAAKLEAMATFFQRKSESRLEVVKAMRIVDKRRGELLGPAEQGRRTDLELLSQGKEVTVSPGAVSKYRAIAAHWQDIWPRITEATDPKQVSQRKCLSFVKKTQATAPKLETCTVEDLHSLVGEKQFGCIYADPPWLYDNQATRASTSNHYGGMTVDELCDLPVKELAAKDAHLHLWITNAFLFDAPRIFDAWGFEFRSSFVWCKPQMGIGNYWRNSHEILLTAIRGDAKRFNDRSLMSHGTFRRTKHSAKPEEIRGYIERASHGPYLELFGRRLAENWTVWGNEIERNLFNQ
jgi:N6-adenosine-specific RNA methylase IME4